MSSVSSLSSSTSGIYGGANRITGLASGLDTDALVESMTSLTRSKIAKQNQQKQILQWQMDAFRSISSKLIDFQEKYTSYASSTNLRSSSFFGKNLITAVGDNSKYISVSGVSQNASNIMITGIEKLAKNANAVSQTKVSDQTLSGTMSDDITTSKFAGKTLSIKFGDRTHTITLDRDKTYDTVDNLVKEINAQFEKIDDVSVGDDVMKLSDVIEVTNDGGSLTLQAKAGYTGNNLQIKGGSDTLLKAIGWEKSEDKTGVGPIKGTETLTDPDMVNKYQEKKTLADMLLGEGKSITFSLDGKTAQIAMPNKDTKLKDGITSIIDNDGNLDKTNFAKYLEEKLADVYGAGRVTVDISGSDIKFATKEGSNSILEVTAISSEVQKGLGIKIGESNRVNLNATVAESGLAGSGVDLANVSINGITLQEMVGNDAEGKPKDLSKMSVSEIMKAINKSDANVNITYIKEADKFSITSTIDGAGGSTDIAGDAATLFGIDPDQIQAGEDAVIYVDYDGEGGIGPVELHRSSNTIDIDGMSVTLKGTFTSDANDPESVITFDAKADTEKVTTAVKDMIAAFNEIIELSNTEVSTKRNRDYEPLTDEQKAEMTEEQIELWEEKAKAGMLFNDSDLRSFTTDIRFLFSGDLNTVSMLEEMGITESNVYSDHGKLSFDEEKFKAYFEKNPDAVAELFTADPGTVTNADGTTSTTKGGIMTQIYDVFEKYAATTGSTKGVFVEKAGAPESPLSILNNFLQTSINDIDEYISTLQEKLEDETERYYQQFASLEVYIQQMNSQSSWLSQQISY